MQTIYTQDAGSQRLSGRKRIALAALAAGLVVAGVWVVAKRFHNTAPAPPDSMTAMGSMAMPPTSSPGQASAASTELEIDLAPDDLKKAQIRTVRVTHGVTAAKLRVPGIVKPNEYSEVHETPLGGAALKEYPLVLSDTAEGEQLLACSF